MSNDNVISVVEERWQELRHLKQPEQTYDEFLNQLVKEHHRRKLTEKALAAREDEIEMVSLDKVFQNFE